MKKIKAESAGLRPLRKTPLLPAAALAVTGLAAAGCAQTNAGQEKPNVILIYIDDMGYSDVCAFGGNYTPTPNIDRIGQEGIQFNQYYTACPISSPSRVGVTTGMYPTKWGITTVPYQMGHHHIPQRQEGQLQQQIERLPPSGCPYPRPLHESRRLRDRTFREMAHGRRT